MLEVEPISFIQFLMRNEILRMLHNIVLTFPSLTLTYRRNRLSCNLVLNVKSHSKCSYFILWQLC